MKGRIIAVGLLALLLTFSIAPTAWAHAELVSSTPAADATLTTAPTQVQLVFSEALKESTAVQVLDGSGKQVNDGTGTLDLNDLDRKTLNVALPRLVAGTYTVEWTSVSDDDGDSEEGSFSFTVVGAAQATAALTVAAQPTATATAQATSAVQPTAAATSVALPRTGESPTNTGWLLVLVVAFAIIIGLAFRQSIKHK